MASYVARVIKFHCVDESGVDFLGSDEVVWIFTANEASGGVHTTNSRKFGNVDSGDTEKFAPNSIVWPKKGDANGAPGPIALSIQLWETDQGDPESIAKKTKQAFDLGGEAPVVGEWVRRVPSIVQEKISSLIADDLMGSKTILYSAGRLAQRLPRVGAKFSDVFRFGGKSGDLPFEVAGGPDYDLRLEVERVA